MELKPIIDELSFVLIYAAKVNEEPTIHVYPNEEERSRAWDYFERTGKLVLNDFELGFVKTVEPVFAARFNMVDGLINVARVKAEQELDGLA